MPAKAVIQYRRDTSSNWTAVNPILASGEPGYETDTSFFKLGDGTTPWSGLPYKKGNDGADAPTIIGFNDQTVTSYTLALSDKDKMVTLANSSAVTLLVPTNAAAAFAVGTTINILQAGTGQVTVAAVTPGTTAIRSTPGVKLRAQWSSASLFKWKTDEWILSGDTTL
jgi:hypothetical protein